MPTTESAIEPTPRSVPAPLRILGALGLIGVVGTFLFEFWNDTPKIDDAYISYRYARNLVMGNGLVFNAGEAVEGYTNFLWTLAIAAGLAVGFTAEATSHALSLASGSFVLVATSQYAARVLPASRAWLGFVPAAIVLASIAFARWVDSGLETPLFVAAVTAALWAQAARRMGWATAAICVATLTRPDGVLVAGAVYVFHLGRNRENLWPALKAPAVFAAVVAAQSLFRFFYYDSLVPNTFYAKVPGVPWQSGLLYLEFFLHEGAFALLLPAAWATWRVPALRPGALTVVAVGIYTVAVGGDVFRHGRFLLPALPALAVLATAGVVDWIRVNRPLAAAGAIALAASIWIPVFGLPTDTLGPPLPRSAALADRRHLDRTYQVIDRKRARILRQRGRPVGLIAATGIGYLGYRTDLPILDLLGLVDATIARQSDGPGLRGMPVPGHARSNAGYVLSRRPDYLIIPRKGSMTFLSAHIDLWQHPDLERLYVWDEEFLGYRLRSAAATP